MLTSSDFSLSFRCTWWVPQICSTNIYLWSHSIEWYRISQRSLVEHCGPSIIIYRWVKLNGRIGRREVIARRVPAGYSRIRTKIIYRFYPRSLRLLRALRSESSRYCSVWCIGNGLGICLDDRSRNRQKYSFPFDSEGIDNLTATKSRKRFVSLPSKLTRDLLYRLFL